MAIKLTKAQNDLLKQIAGKNGFKEYVTKVYTTASKGDNYLGELLCVTVEESDKTIEMIFKRAPSNENFRKSLPVRDMYLKEIYMYDEVLSAFTNFQIEHNVQNPFNGLAKLYGTCEEEGSECLVLENLVKSGYNLWNRKLPMNHDHIELVMKEYGKFHAVSFAMKNKDPELFRKITQPLTKDHTEYEKQNLQEFLKSSCGTLQKVVKGDPIMEKTFLKIVSNLENYFSIELQEPKDKMVITHGDCWCNNMLFKYEVSF